MKEHDELVTILAEAWSNLDASELVKYIHPDFQYDYSGSQVEVSIVDDDEFGAGKMVKLVQNKTKPAVLRIEASDGKITKMDMCMF